MFLNTLLTSIRKIVDFIKYFKSDIYGRLYVLENDFFDSSSYDISQFCLENEFLQHEKKSR